MGYYADLAEHPEEFFDYPFYEKKRDKGEVEAKGKDVASLVDKVGRSVAAKDGTLYVQVIKDGQPLQDEEGNYIFHLIDEKTGQPVMVPKCANFFALRAPLEIQNLFIFLKVLKIGEQIIEVIFYIFCFFTVN